MIQPYVISCLEEGQTEQAREALKYADKRISRERGSILDLEFSKLEMLLQREKI
ncbi:MAG: hypothetical protein HC904_15680 [Blastochloris sp.]|nr:hypothetical protein [Blastochloris sp.]